MIFLLDRVHLVQSILPLDLLGMSLEFLVYAIILFGFRIFDPIPLARRTAIEQLHSSMLVLDTQGKIVSLNPAAERILEVPSNHAKGRPIQELLPAYPDGELATATSAEIEVSLGSGETTRCYTMEVSPLNDWRGLAVGRLLLLHDVTDQQRAQAQLMEQQRALAMLHEREQLSRELHDSIGQVLGYAGFQLEAVQGLIIEGQTALSAGQVADLHANLDAAGKQLMRLSSVVEEAHADVREYILNLRLAPSDQRPFFVALQHYLNGFSQNYGIQAELTVGAGVDAKKLDAEAQMQLFRIVQEALSNARKHAGASRVQVSFGLKDQRICILIQDNGSGFDPEQAVQDGSNHFGLRFMHERAEEIGGSLRVESALNAGTCVVVDLPTNQPDGWRGDANLDR
jgi:PAS domain S-box-containing protein